VDYFRSSTASGWLTRLSITPGKSSSEWIVDLIMQVSECVMQLQTFVVVGIIQFRQIQYLVTHMCKVSQFLTMRLQCKIPL
jgi:hypothetical protein